MCFSIYDSNANVLTLVSISVGIKCSSLSEFQINILLLFAMFKKMSASWGHNCRCMFKYWHFTVIEHDFQMYFVYFTYACVCI